METIDIGIGSPLSGPAAQLGREMVQAIQLAVEEKNRQGGVGGHPIRTLVHDDENQPQTAESTARKLATAGNLAGVIGHYSSDASLAAAPVYATNGLCLLAPISSSPRLTESGWPTIFRYTNRDDRTARAIADYLYRETGKHKAVVIRSETAYGSSMAGEFARAFAAEGGELAGMISIPEGQTDLQLFLRRLPPRFDLVFYGGSFEGAPLLRALRATGHPQLMATGDGCWDVPNFLLPAGELAETGEGVLVLSASNAVGDTEGSSRFASAYRSRYGEIGNYALNSYDCACILLQAIEEAMPSAHGAVPTRTAVAAAVSNIRFRGIANGNWVAWDGKGDNLGAITRLNVARGGAFTEVASFPAGFFCVSR